MCELAVKSNGRALEFIPDEMKTEKLCLAAVKQHDERNRHIQRYLIPVLNFVPEHLKTPKICRAAVVTNGRSMYHVPDEMHTLEMYEIAAKTYGRSYNSCLMNGKALKYAWTRSLKTGSA